MKAQTDARDAWVEVVTNATSVSDGMRTWALDESTLRDWWPAAEPPPSA